MSLKTGLIDLNGIEIEEGHIIVFQSEYNEDKPNQYEPRYKVQFDFGAFVGIKQYTIENGKLYTEKKTISLVCPITELKSSVNTLMLYMTDTSLTMAKLIGSQTI